MVLSMTVLACTQTKLGSFSITLSAVQAKGLPIPAGKYYIYSDVDIKEGTTFIQDMDVVEVKEKPFTFTTKEGEEIETTLRILKMKK